MHRILYLNAYVTLKRGNSGGAGEDPSFTIFILITQKYQDHLLNPTPLECIKG